MKKIIFLVDALQVETGALDLAAFLCRQNNCKLTGLFVEHATKEKLYAAAAANGIDTTPAKSIQTLEAECLSVNVKHFSDACESRGIGYEITRLSGAYIDAIVKETRYADILLIDAAMSFDNVADVSPNNFVKDILSGSECPVMIIPRNFDGLDAIVFAYDGSASSVFAMKQFTYNFSRFWDKKVIVVTINSSGMISQEEKLKMESWLSRYYANIEFKSLEGNSKSGLLEFVLGKERIMIVMGAYGRNPVSNFFSGSHATPITRYTSKPVFISHY